MERRNAHWRAALMLLIGGMIALLAVSGCTAAEEPSSSSEEPVEVTPLVLASTTSTQDSGLFDVLIPAFTEAYPQYEVKVVAVGTGEALQLGETKDADVLLVHAKADEEQFVVDGFGTERRDVMYNDFIIVGPEGDPAGLADADLASDALALIPDSGASFVTRGDDSGTEKKELKLWDAAGITPEGDWYVSTGQGMGETLRIASEKQAYTLADRATYLSMKDTLELVISYEKSDDLLNQYGVIPISDATNSEGAMDFTDWITSPEGQTVIEEYGIEEYGEPLFIPNAE